ncbi:hypothetical protein EYF80_062137 [Liparis tanakae]|uniref:Uncharacterized protein n=1 Tax=Liparis tanakae TaxID=230148 RepID=A0A4Z2EFR1_9TELE|nr:hypothetical protein EYF80_062137 [Liparis tanakae]
MERTMTGKQRLTAAPWRLPKTSNRCSHKSTVSGGPEVTSEHMLLTTEMHSGSVRDVETTELAWSQRPHEHLKLTGGTDVSEAPMRPPGRV